MSAFIKVCPSCRNEMGTFAGFCNRCGYTLAPAASPIDLEEQNEMTAFFCNEKGHKLQVGFVGARYCSFCGRDLA